MIKFETKNVGRGKVGIFIEQEPMQQPTTKKFSYKQKAQKFSLRDTKAMKEAEAQVQEKPVQRKPWGANQPTRKKPSPSLEKAIAKSEKTENGEIESVTLTQDQLTTILASIGQMNSKEAVDITVDTKDHKVSIHAAPSGQKEISNDTDQDDKDSALGEDSVTSGEEKRHKKKTERGEKMKVIDQPKALTKIKKITAEEKMQKLIDENLGKMSEEELIDLLAQAYLEDQKEALDFAGEQDSEDARRKKLDKNKRKKEGIEKNHKERRRQGRDKSEIEVEEENKNDWKKTNRTDKKEEKQGTEKKEIDIPHSDNSMPVPLSKAEKLRLKWMQERSELSGLAQQGGWDPWGRPGAGAPLSPRADLLTSPTSAFPTPHHILTTRQQHAAAAAPASALPYGHNTNLPVAVRSSLMLGTGGVTEDRFAAQRREEKQKWLQELEKQRNEKRQQHSVVTTESNQVPGFNQTNFVEAANYAPSFNRTTIVEPSQVPGLALSPNASLTAGDLNPYLRGHGLDGMHLDSKSLVEVEEKRRRQQEHQSAVREQVEERKRLQEREKNRQIEEEREEERRLQAERNRLQAQFQSEQEKQKRKQDEEEQRVQQLNHTFHLAEEQARLEKQARRLRHLEEGGHDTTALRHHLTARSLENMSDGQLYQQQHQSHQPPTHRSIEVMKTVDDERAFHVSPRRPAPAVTHAVQTDPVLLDSLLLDNRHRLPPAPAPAPGLKLKLNATYKQPQHHRHRHTGIDHQQEQPAVVGTHTDRSTGPVAIHERPQWNARNPLKAALPQSQRDLNYQRQKQERESRRRQRESYLMTQIDPMTGRVPAGAMQQQKQQHPVDKFDHSTARQNVVTDRKTARGRESPPIPAVLHKMAESHAEDWFPTDFQQAGAGAGTDREGPGNFVRTSDVLDPSAATRPLPLSRENTARQDARQAYLKSLNPAQFGKPMEPLDDRRVERMLPPKNQVKDPIYNPGLVKDVPTPRQDAILAQLSNIRQGLLQKQREIETSLSMET